MKTSLRGRSGFTLIELLLVIGIIAILAAIVIVAINPTKQLGDARDAQRRSDVNTLLNAVWQYAIDNNGSMPTDVSATAGDIDSTWRMLGDPATGCDTVGTETGADHNDCDNTEAPAAECIIPDGLTGTYLVAIPSDPRWGSGSISTTGGNQKSYYIVRNTSNRVTVRACHPEQTTSAIEVTR